MRIVFDCQDAILAAIWEALPGRAKSKILEKALRFYLLVGGAGEVLAGIASPEARQEIRALFEREGFPFSVVPQAQPHPDNGTQQERQRAEGKEKLAELIIQKAFRYSKEPVFKLASGRMSQYYFNCKPVTMSPEGMYLIGKLFFEKLLPLKPDAVGGLTLGADPISHAICLTSYLKGYPIKGFTIRKKPKGHGTNQWIEGDVQSGERAVIVEDVVTSGGSVIEAIQKARKGGLKVLKVIALVDREEGGRENILKYADFESLFTRTELMQRTGHLL